MIFTGIKRKSAQIFFNKKLQRFLKKSQDKSFDKCEKIIIFLDDISNQNSVVSSLRQHLSIDIRKLEFIVFQSKNLKEASSDLYFSPKDFGYYGNIKNSELKSLITKKYDLLINYGKVENVYTNILILQTAATLKVGFSDFDKRLYDFMIACEISNIDLFNSELGKYLEIIKNEK